MVLIGVPAHFQEIPYRYFYMFRSRVLPFSYPGTLSMIDGMGLRNDWFDLINF